MQTRGAYAFPISPTAPVGVPSYLSALSVYETKTLSNTNISLVNAANNPEYNPNHPSSAPWLGASGFNAIMSAWSGGAYDTKRHRMLIFGGGHGDYGGNDVYASNVARELPNVELLVLLAFSLCTVSCLPH